MAVMKERAIRGDYDVMPEPADDRVCRHCDKQNGTLKDRRHFLPPRGYKEIVS